MKKFLALALFALICTPFAKADSGTTTYYNVTGSMSITGNAACGGCVETVNFSFVGEELSPPASDSFFAAAGPISFTDSGPFDFNFAGLLVGNSAVEFTNTADPTGAEMDFNIGNEFNADGSLPVARNSTFYFCESATCGADFSVFGTPFSGGTDSNLGTATWSLTPIATPEPSELALLLPALLAFPLMRRRRVA